MKKKIFKLVTTFAAVGLGTTLIACNQQAPVEQVNEQGIYYFEKDSNEYLCTLTGNTFTFFVDGVQYSGSLEMKEEAVTFVFKGDEDANLPTAALVDGGVSLTLNGQTYKFITKTNYKVTFNAGDEKINTTVTNGKTVSELQAPTKAGYAFVGWYADNAYTTLFDFANTTITADTNVYARYVAVEDGAYEYTVELVDNGEVVSTMKTVSGVAFNLPNPTDSTFAGWWVSSTNSADNLTYKYEGQVLTENTKLFAVYAKDKTPLVNIADNKITWTSAGVGASYTVEITDPNGESTTKTIQANFLDYTFTEAGAYTVKVTANGLTGTATYLNKALATVSNFEIVAGNVLSFNPVAGAEGYILSVECGTEGHNHQAIDLGSKTVFDFSKCEMAKGGIKFTVTAYADGYVTSISETYVYNLELDAVSGLKVENDVVVWDAVKNAEAYKVVITQGTGDDAVENTITVTSTNFKLDEFTGAMVIAVYPVTSGYNAPEATTVEYNKTTLAAPTEVAVVGDKITWTEVAGAVGYNVKIGDKVYTTEGAELQLTEDMALTGNNYYGVSVQAVAADAKNNSKYTAVSNVGYLTEIKDVEYVDGALTWDYVVGAATYYVQVGDAEAVETTVNSAAVKLAHAGYNTISVWYVDADGNKSDVKSVEVYAYEIRLDACNETEGSTVYFVEGDTVTITAPERRGYTFAGWYNRENAITTTGVKYADGFVMPANGIILYANWIANTYDVRFVVEEKYGEFTGEGATVTYDSNFYLEVPTSKSTIMAFGGWYSQPNGQGVRYTDQNGESISTFTGVESITAYAYFAEIFTFEEVKRGDAVIGYRAEKAAGISFVTDVVVPATYTYEATEIKVSYPQATVTADTFEADKYYVLPADSEEYVLATEFAADTVYFTKEEKEETITKELPVVELGSFASTSTMVKLSIPDTITYIDVTLGLTSCTKLEEINVYDADPTDNIELVYTSYEGVLYYYDSVSENAGWEVAYFPLAKTGEVHIMAGTVNIGLKKMYNVKVSKVYIPYTVRTIGEQAFYLASSIEEIVFEATPEGVEPATLRFGANAFQSCSKLVEFTFPARTESIDPTMFTSCTKLENIYVDGATSSSTFYSKDGMLCSNTSTINGKTVENTPAVVYCPKGKSGEVTIPAGILAVADSAFTSCTYITKVTIPGYVKFIGFEAFKGLSTNEAIVFEGDEASPDLYIYDSAFYTNTLITEITLPANVVYVGKNAFGGTTKLTKVTINSARENLELATGVCQYTSTTGIGSCYVEELVIGPKCPTFAVSGAFGGTLDRLAKVTVDPANTAFVDEAGVLFNSDKSTLLFYSSSAAGGHYVVPETVKEIADGAFTKRTSITKITIGKNVTKIGVNAFYYCTGLTEVNFEQDGTEDLIIDDNAFYYCYYMTKINLPSRTKSLGVKAFYDAYRLTSITIPEGVESLGASCFYYCSGLTSISLPSTLKTLGEYDIDSLDETKHLVDVFTYCSALKEIIVAEGNQNFASAGGILYASKDGYATELCLCPAGIVGEIVIPSTVSRINAKAFYNNKNITKVSFKDNKSAVYYETNEAGETVEKQGTLTVGTYAFYYCTSMTTCDLPNLANVADHMFYYCSLLDNFKVANTVQTISNYAFYYCKSLKNVIFEEGGTDSLTIVDATSYSPAPFYGTGITEMVLPERTASIGNYTFYGITTLKKVVVPSSVTSIGTYTFYGCTNLTDVVLNTTDGKTNLATISNYAFYNTGIKSIVLPEGLETIADDAFYTCKYLETVSIPASVKTIGAYAFNGNKALTSVTFAEGSKLESIGNYAFANDALLTEITLPASLKKIGTYAFNACSALATITFAEKASITDIGNNAFANTAITEFTFPTTYDAKDEVIAYSGTIGTGLFTGCKKLTKVVISASVKSVSGVFSGCSTITDLTVDSANQNFLIDATGNFITNKVFKEAKITAFEAGETYYTYDSTKKNYFVATEFVEGTDYFYSTGDTIIFAFGNSLGDLTISSDFTMIEANAFRYNASLTSVYIPKSIEYIGNYAFAECSNLKTVEFEAGSTIKKTAAVTAVATTKSAKNAAPTIGQYIFFKDTELTTISLPDQLTEVPAYAFEYCTSITNLTLSTKITTIGNYAFAYSGLMNVVLPKTVTKLGTYAFSHIATLESFEFTGTITDANFGSYAVGYNDNLKTLTFAAAQTTIPAYAFGYNKGLETVTIPSKVTKIGNYAFYYCSSIKSITLPETVTSLGTYVFYQCTSLEKVNIPAKVTSIGNYAFAYTAIEEVTIPETVKTLGTYLFYYAKTKKVVVNANVKEIPTYMFYYAEVEEVEINSPATYIGNHFAYYCKQLKKVKFPETLTTLPTYLFYQCSELEEFNLPDSVTVIGASTATAKVTSSTYGYFCYYCPKLTTITSTNSAVTVIPGYSFYHCDSLETLNFPNVTEMGSYAFAYSGMKSVDISNVTKFYSSGQMAYCPNLEEVKLSSSMTEITSYMFRNCASLKKIDLPKSVTKIGTYAFNGAALESIDLSNVETLDNYCLYGNNLTEVDLTNVKTFGNDVLENNTLLTKVTLNDALTAIPESLFQGCTSLENITLPAGVTEIGPYAFAETGIKSFTVPAGVEELSERVFYACDNLTEIKFAGNKVTKIGTYALSYMDNLKSFTIPETVTEIASYAFAGSAIEGEMYIPAAVEEMGDNPFAGTKIGSFKVSSDNGNYKTGRYNSLLDNENNLICFPTTYEGEITLEENVYILPNAFCDCNGITKITVPESMTTIPTYAFANMSGLEEVIIPEGVTTLESYILFRSSLAKLTIPESVTTMADRVFAYAHVKEYDIKAKITRLPSYAFDHTEETEKITFPSTLETLGSYAFYYAKINGDVTIPNTVKNIENYQFYYASVKGTITIPSSIESFGNYFMYYSKPTDTYPENGIHKVKFEDGATTLPGYFCYQTAVDELELPSTLTTLSSYAFYYFQGAKLEFADGLKIVGDRAFNYSAVEEVILPSTVEEIGAYAFYYAKMLKSFVVPAKVETINTYTFYHCDSLKSVTFAGDIKELGTYAFAYDYELKQILIPASCVTIETSAFAYTKEDQTIYFRGSELDFKPITAAFISSALAKCVYGWEGDLPALNVCPTCGQEVH